MADYDYRNSEIYKKAVERYNVIQEAKKTATQTNAYSPEKIIPLQKAIEKKVTEEREKNIQQQQDKGREETLKRAPEITAAEKQKAEKALSDFDEKGEYDWTDQNSRKQYEAERKNLQAAVEKSGAELAQRERDLYAREHPGSAPYSMEMERNLNFANNNWDSTYYDPYDGGAYHARKEKEKAEREAAKAAKAESSVPETQSSIDEVRKQYQESLSALEDYKKSTPIPVTGGFGIDQGQPDANSEQYRKTVELESRANNLKRQLESMEAQEITDKNMAEIEKMTPEARKHLEALTNLNSASKYYGTYSGGQVNTDFVQEEARRQQEARQALIDMGYSVDKISKLAASLSRYNNARDAENMKKETEELADSGFWGSVAGNAISLATNVAAGPAGTLEALGSMIAPDSEYKTADPNMPGYATGMFTEGIRGATSENIREMPGGAALDIGYKGLMGALDNVARLYAGGGGKVGSLLLSSTGAFQNTFRESVQKGDPTWKAALSGVVDAGIEEFTEKYSLDNLLDDPVPITSLKQMVKTALKQGAVEASEEEVGLVLNVFADLLINGDRSEMVTSIQDMVANGESYEEAQREYIKGKAHEAMDTALTSMVSGAGMSVGRNILIGNTPGKNAKMANAEQTTDAAPGTPDNADFHVTPDGDAIPVNNNQQTQETPGPATDSPQSASTNPGTVADTAESVMRGENTAPAKSGETAIWEAANAIANGTFTEKMLTPVLENPDAMALLHDRYGLTLDGADPQNRNAVWQLLGDIAYGKAERKDFTASWTDGLKDQTPPPPPKTPVQEQLDRAAQATFDGAPVDDAHASGEGTAVNTSPAAEAQRKTEAAKMTMRKALNGRITPDVLSEITNNDQILRFLNEYCGLELYNGRKMNDIRADVRSIFDYAKQNGARNNLERSLSVFLDDEFGSEYYSVEYQNAQPSSRETPVNASLAQNQPTANGQPVANPAVGAADANFTGRAAYADLLSDENSQPDRPTDVRPMEVPRRNADGRRVTEFAADAYAAPVTPDHMANAIESLIQDGELSFDTRTNKESLENARKVIKKDGEEETIRRISDNARAGRIQDGDIEQGLILYAQYANDPKLQDKASSMLVDLGKIANMSGRNLQMFALLRRMTPEGQMMAVEKNISRYADGINKRRGRRNQFTDTDINPDLKRAFMSATNDEERQSAADAIYMDVAAKIKPTLGEQWDAWRNLSMLGNPITHMRNVGATGAFQPFVHVKRNIAGALQALTMKKEQRTESMFGLGIGKKGRDLLSFAWEDSKTQEAKGLMGLTSTTGDEARTAIDENRKVLPGALDKVAKFNMDAMEAEDFVFKREEYAYSLASFLKARGYDADQVKSGQIPNGVMMEARQHAAGAAMKATFNDNNAFSDWMVSTLRPKYGGSVDPFLNVVKKGCSLISALPQISLSVPWSITHSEPLRLW